jgi:hypothetical protein
MRKMADAKFDSLTIGEANGTHLFLGSRVIKLYDDAAHTRAELCMDDENPMLLMYDRHGKDRLMVGIDCDGTPYLRLHDANGKKRVDVTVNPDGSPLLQFFDATEVVLFGCTLIDGETPSLSFYDHDEELRFHLLLNDDQVDMIVSPKTGQEYWSYVLRQLMKKGV